MNTPKKAAALKFTMTMVEAMDEYCLHPPDFITLQSHEAREDTSLKNSASATNIMFLYRPYDCHQAALKRYRSKERLEATRRAIAEKRMIAVEENMETNCFEVSALGSLPTSKTKIASKDRRHAEESGCQERRKRNIAALSELEKLCPPPRTELSPKKKRKTLVSKMQSPEYARSNMEFAGTTFPRKKKKIHVASPLNLNILASLSPESKQNPAILSTHDSPIAQRNATGRRKTTLSPRSTNESRTSKKIISKGNAKNIKISETTRHLKCVCTCQWSQLTAAYHVLVDEARGYLWTPDDGKTLSRGEKLMLQNLLAEVGDGVRTQSARVMDNRKLALRSKEAANHCKKLRDVAVTNISRIQQATNELKQMQQRYQKRETMLENKTSASRLLQIVEKLSNKT